MSDPTLPDDQWPDYCRHEYIGHGTCGLTAERHRLRTGHDYVPTCLVDSRRGDGPLGGVCQLPAYHNGPHEHGAPHDQ